MEPRREVAQNLDGAMGRAIVAESTHPAPWFAAEYFLIGGLETVHRYRCKERLSVVRGGITKKLLGRLAFAAGIFTDEMIMARTAAVQSNQVKARNRPGVAVTISAQNARPSHRNRGKRNSPSIRLSAIERNGRTLLRILVKMSQGEFQSETAIGIHPSVVTSCTFWLMYRFSADKGLLGVHEAEDIFQFAVAPEVPAAAGDAFHGGGGSDIDMNICITGPAIRLPYMSRATPGRKIPS